MKRSFLCVAAAVSCWASINLNASDLPGVRPDGSVLLPNQWLLRPAGKQVELGNFPVNVAVHPRGKYAAVLHSGYGKHEIIVVNIKDAVIASRTQVHETFYGLAFSHDGRHLYCSGAGDEVVHIFNFLDGAVADDHAVRVHEPAQRGVPCGLAVSAKEDRLYTANLWGQRVSEIDLLAHTNRADFTFGVGESNLAPNFSQSGEVSFDVASVTKRLAASLDPTAPDAPFPYGCVLDEARNRLYVSLWARACVAVIDLDSKTVTANWPTEEHPNEMALSKSGHYLYVANGNRNTVTVIDTVYGQTVETLDASLSPNSAAGITNLLGTPPEGPGSTPNSLAISPDTTKLFVANAGNNDVAVFDIATPGHSRALGFIPVGKYPTSVRVTPDGRHLLVANGKGIAPRANPEGPQPGKRGEGGRQYIADLVPGTLSIIDLPRGKDWKKALETYTAQAYENIPRHGAAPAPAAADNPIPPTTGHESPIKYCIYIIKENRTYDQVFGDLPQGNGDAKICLFPESGTPNHHKLAREFVLFDNFYVDAEVSAAGHEWSTGAMATDFVEKNWPVSYGHNQAKKYPYPAEGNFPAAYPANGYLWDRAREAGISYRSYGEFVSGLKNGTNFTKVAGLRGHIDPLFHGFDVNYPDAKRADRFIAELGRFEAEGDMPRLQIVRLPNDHTAGGAAGALSPAALVGDNDLALGRLVEAVSHSKFWAHTAIFVLEDDAQNGPDHIDAHRSVLLVASPYARRGVVDSTMYSTSSVLHTMELILGLKPMTQFDAAAMPMFNAFAGQPNLAAYQAAPAGVDLQQRNPKAGKASRESAKMDFSREDAVDDFALNRAIWHAVRGDAATMPAPVHAAFIFAGPKDHDDDDD
ncbi:MAG TPA: bifunctional YncE family protein/alkaline phosphatase family protein [Verrucomicrobiae bacterium]|jgi:DNA-binding beta-propeller fold protein YncE|nr:bifunctional YncE family protein/alkaline phosphatase family protein [Verrucomicrobiae bacterium]